MKQLLTQILISLATNSFSQFTKGSLMIEGSGNFTSGNSTTDFSTGSNNTSNSNSFRLTPEVKYFLRDNFAITGGLNYNSSISSSTSNNSSSESKAKSIGLFGGVQRIDMLTEKFGMSFGMNLSISTPLGLKEEDLKTKNLSLGLANIGIIYKLNNKFALEGSGNLASLSYSRGSRTSTVSDYKTSNISIGFGLPSFGLGLLYLLR
jgi:hypothetical protein